MTPQELADRIRRVLGGVAPETAAMAIDPEIPLREATELDSMDFLNFVIGLHREFGIDVPEKDYAKLASLSGCAQYITARLPEGDTPAAAAARSA